MKYGPFEIQDKLGGTVVLRSPELSDAEALIEYMKGTSGETRFLLNEPETVTITMDQEIELLKGRIAAERELMLIAEVDGEIAGCSALMEIDSRPRFVHRCGLAIALYKKYWGRGIGRAMMETLLNVAKDQGYEQAELEVMEGNERAKALYESLGFVQYGILPNNMKYKDGTYADSYWMMKKL